MSHVEGDMHHHNHEKEQYDKTLFGFWVYLVTDFMLFATFFATYAVLGKNTFGGPSPSEVLHFPIAFWQTIVLLVSSLTVGFAGALTHKGRKGGAIGWFAVTFLLGIVFLIMQFYEYNLLVESGNNWARNAFTASFFTLVGMHTLHVIFGLIWFIVILIPVFGQGFNATNVRRLSCLKMFWQFLYVVWIFIFTIVYLVGVN